MSLATEFKDYMLRGRVHILLMLPLLLFWIPILRFGFDPHHDGLIMASVTNLDFQSTSMPFNQYGPAWFIILKIITTFTPPSYLFLTLRIITLSFYMLSFVATYLLSKKFLSTRASLTVVVVLLAIQPFITDFNSDMIPWPSALSMFLVPLVGFLVIENPDLRSRIFIRYRMWLAGLLVVITIFTRVQIGVALAACILFILTVYRRRYELVHFASGLFASSLLALLIFLKLGWVGSLITDVLGFGSTYAFGDRATYPKPIWTALLTFILVAVFLLPKKDSKYKLIFRNKFFLGISLILSFIVGLLILDERGLDPIQVLTVLFRRFWISGLLAATIIGSVVLLSSLITTRKLPEINFAVLVATSLVAELQVWPLFDQMHAWWSATPSVILGVFLLKSLPAVRHMNKPRKLFLESTTLVVITLIATTTFMSTINNVRKALPIQGFSGILISESEGKELVAVNDFLNKNVTNADSVLNLCTNANVFFQPEAGHDSAARSFIFWTPMFDLSQLRKDILNSNPSKIITCSFVTNQIFYPEYREKQLEILNHFELLNKESSSFESPNGVNWVIYSRSS